MPEYRPQGRGHRCLTQLRAGPATLYEMRAASCTTRRQGLRLWHMLDATIRHGFVAFGADAYRLTSIGAETLATLDSGQPVEVEDAPRTSVRVFGLKEAA